MLDRSVTIYRLTYVGKVPGIDELTQINLRLPATLPAGDLSVNIRLRGRGSNFVRLRVKQ